ncbi:MAG: hypothetical protein U0235_25555 [Polyangiaceae bacterium]
MRLRTCFSSLLAALLSFAAAPAFADEPTSPAPAPTPTSDLPVAPVPMEPAPAPPLTSTPPPPPPPAEPAAEPAAPAPEGTPETPKPAEPPPKEEEKDEGVGFKWVYLVPEVGYSYINLKSFSETNLAIVDSSKSGAMVGAGAGIRLVFLTLGVRARHHFAMGMWQVMGEAGLHLKVNRIDPYIAFRGGYDTVGNFSQALGNAVGDVKVDVKGWNAGGAIGFDYFVGDNVTLGVEGSADLLFLTRPKPALPAGLTPAQQAAITSNPLYRQSGSSVGFGGVLAGRLGFHF